MKLGNIKVDVTGVDVSASPTYVLLDNGNYDLVVTSCKLVDYTGKDGVNRRKVEVSLREPKSGTVLYKDILLGDVDTNGVITNHETANMAKIGVVPLIAIFGSKIDNDAHFEPDFTGLVVNSWVVINAWTRGQSGDIVTKELEKKIGKFKNSAEKARELCDAYNDNGGNPLSDKKQIHLKNNVMTINSPTGDGGYFLSSWGSLWVSEDAFNEYRERCLGAETLVPANPMNKQGTAQPTANIF